MEALEAEVDQLRNAFGAALDALVSDAKAASGAGSEDEVSRLRGQIELMRVELSRRSVGAGGSDATGRAEDVASGLASVRQVVDILRREVTFLDTRLAREVDEREHLKGQLSKLERERETLEEKSRTIESDLNGVSESNTRLELALGRTKRMVTNLRDSIDLANITKGESPLFTKRPDATAGLEPLKEAAVDPTPSPGFSDGFGPSALPDPVQTVSPVLPQASDSVVTTKDNGPGSVTGGILGPQTLSLGQPLPFADFADGNAFPQADQAPAETPAEKQTEDHSSPGGRDQAESQVASGLGPQESAAGEVEGAPDAGFGVVADVTHAVRDETAPFHDEEASKDPESADVVTTEAFGDDGFGDAAFAEMNPVSSPQTKVTVDAPLDFGEGAFTFPAEGTLGAAQPEGDGTSKPPETAELSSLQMWEGMEDGLFEPLDMEPEQPPPTASAVEEPQMQQSQAQAQTKEQSEEQSQEHGASALASPGNPWTNFDTPGTATPAFGAQVPMQEAPWGQTEVTPADSAASAFTAAVIDPQPSISTPVAIPGKKAAAGGDWGGLGFGTPGMDWNAMGAMGSAAASRPPADANALTFQDADLIPFGESTDWNAFPPAQGEVSAPAPTPGPGPGPAEANAGGGFAFESDAFGEGGSGAPAAAVAPAAEQNADMNDALGWESIWDDAGGAAAARSSHDPVAMDALPGPAPGSASNAPVDPFFEDAFASVPTPTPTPTPTPSPAYRVMSDLEIQKCDEAFIKLVGASNTLATKEELHKYYSLTQLPEAIFERIWTLSDTRACGALSLTEFYVFMYLMTFVAQQQDLPASLSEQDIARILGSRARMMPPPSQSHSQGQAHMQIQGSPTEDPKVKQLMGLGFPADEAKRGLDETGGNVDQAANFLFDKGKAAASGAQGAGMPSSSSSRIEPAHADPVVRNATLHIRGVPADVSTADKLFLQIRILDANSKYLQKQQLIQFPCTDVDKKTKLIKVDRAVELDHSFFALLDANARLLFEVKKSKKGSFVGKAWACVDAAQIAKVAAQADGTPTMTVLTAPVTNKPVNAPLGGKKRSNRNLHFQLSW